MEAPPPTLLVTSLLVLRVNIMPFHCIPGGNRYSVMAKIK
jgi:hypothetical protein